MNKMEAFSSKPDWGCWVGQAPGQHQAGSKGTSSSCHLMECMEQGRCRLCLQEGQRSGACWQGGLCIQRGLQPLDWQEGLDYQP